MHRGLNAIELDRLYRAVRHRLLGEQPRPLTIAGRTVTRRLGTGGTGLVYAAFDPDLDRQVALKLVPTGDDATATMRVFQEARTLARLTDPHVVDVYEVGRHEDHVFIVMALVEGCTADAWAEHEAPSVSRICGVFARLATGLAAVHDAGLCHRDVKPTNVLVGRGDAPCLIDFGLAAPASGREPAPRERGPSGAALGTPGYLAPELARGEPPSPASDQFAFFVTLDEVLTRAGHRARPRAVRRILARGLASAPQRRWPSMHAVALALTAAARPRSPLRWLVPATATAIAALVLAGGSGGRCADARPPALDAAVLEALSVRTAVGPAAAAALAHGVQQWGAAWTLEHTAACHAALPDAIFDARMQCLARARTQARALLDALHPADLAALTHAAAAVAELPAPADCAAARDEPPVDPARAEALAHAAALRRLGKYGAARPALEDLAARAPAASELLAEATYELGVTATQGRDPAAATAAWQRAIEAAHAVGRVDLEASGWLQLALVALTRAGRPDEARQHLAHARAAVELSGDRVHRLRLLSLEALLARAEGDRDHAEAMLQRALAQAEALQPAAPALVASLLNNLAGLVEPPQRALELHRRALAIRVDTFGPAHPDVAMSQMNIALTLVELGEHGAALAAFDEVIATATQVAGADEPGLARVWLPRARAALAHGDLQAARADAERALALAERGAGPDLAAQARAFLDALP